MDSDDKKITQLTLATSLSDSDLLVTVVNIGTAPETKAIAKSNAAKLRQVYGGHGNGGTVPATTSYYIVPMISGLGTTGRAFPIPLTGTLKNLYVRLGSAQPGTGSLVIEIFGGASAAIATGIKITIPAGGGAVTYSDLSNTFSHTAGDLVNVKITNNATGASGVIAGVSFLLESNLG